MRLVRCSQLAEKVDLKESRLLNTNPEKEFSRILEGIQRDLDAFQSSKSKSTTILNYLQRSIRNVSRIPVLAIF